MSGSDSTAGAGRAPRLLCVDFGTSSIKGGVIDADGRLLCWAHESLVDDPDASYGAWNPDIWLHHMRPLVAELLARPAQAVDAVVLSGNGPTLVPIAADGSPSGDALLWLDQRARFAAGGRSFFLPKASWIKSYEPGLWERSAAFLPFPEYLNFVLTGERGAIVPSDEFIPYYWDDEGFRLYELEPARFPGFTTVGSRIGRVTAAGSEATGVPERLPVIAGGSDFLMALLGTGTVAPGLTCDRAGTSEGINHCTSQPVSSDRVRCLPHAVPGLYNAAGILGSTGRMFEWFRSISGQARKSYRAMLEEILQVPHGARIPYFFPSMHVGETWEFSDAVFTHIAPGHGAAEMGRAVVESIGFAVRDLIETLGRSGCRIEQLRACGGQARNVLWNQMKADITGHEIAVPEIIDAELLGNACAGLAGLGLFASPAEASAALARIDVVYRPRREEHARFTEAYERYRELRNRIVRAVATAAEAPPAGGLVE